MDGSPTPNERQGAADGLLTSATLLNRLKDPEDAEARALFYARYLPFIDDKIQAMNISGADSDQVAMNVLIRILRRLRTFDYRGDGFRAYLATVTRNCVWSYWNRIGKHGPRTVGEEEFARMLSERAVKECAEAMEMAYRSEILREILDAMEAELGTKPDRAEAFRLVIREQKKAQEVAERLGIEPKTIYIWKHRWMKEIKARAARLLDGEGGASDDD